MVLNMFELFCSRGNQLVAENLSIVVNVWGKDDPAAFRRSMLSIRAQETKAKELIVVVDGPINAYLERSIQELHELNLRVIRVPKATGLWNARNIGIFESGTEFIALHDADDVMHPKRLTYQLKEIQERKADIVTSPVYEFDVESEKLIGLRNLCDNNNLRKKLRWQNVINHSSVLLRRSAVLDVGGYRNIYLAEDYDLWIRMIQNGKQFFYMPRVVQAFSVDSELSKRRGGLRSIKSELAIHKTISEAGEMNAIKMTIRLVIRIVFRTSPRFVRNAHRRLWQVSKQNNFKSLSDYLVSDSQ